MKLFIFKLILYGVPLILFRIENEYAQKILTRANPEIYISGLFDIIAQEYTNAKKEPQS